ncbi:hypothetical protein OH77DRAFT_1412360, partial [Trametes cingulata]
EFCIITPYDAQRALITEYLDDADLPSDNVYNVDSFQGHEAQYVLISVVRTTTPGFLRSPNRLNVMLSRCQAGMVLVTKRAFLWDGGRRTLVGKLAREWESWSARPAWVDAREVANGRADMPGAPGLPFGS